MKTKHDWTRADALTDEQVHAAALADPDAQPLTPERLAGIGQMPRLKIIRRALGLTQEEFAARIQIPLSTLRDWERAPRNRIRPPGPTSAPSLAIRMPCNEPCTRGHIQADGAACRLPDTGCWKALHGLPMVLPR